MRSSKSSPAQIAALKRLSVRAASHPHHSNINNSNINSNSNSKNGLFPLMGIIDKLRLEGVPMEEGLSEEHLCRIEASLNFTFPPDLRALLHEVLPVGVGFVDWRSNSLHQLHLLFTLPSIQVARSHAHFWMPKHWGRKPSNQQLAHSIARNALNKAPLLIPLFSHYYLPSSPNLIGNPLFFISPCHVHLASFNLQHFFQNHHFKPQIEHLGPFVSTSRATQTRHIQFWSDLAQIQHLRDFELSFENHLQSPTSFCYGVATDGNKSIPLWLEEFQSGLMSTLRQGGWEEADILEMMKPHFTPYNNNASTHDPSKKHLYLDKQSALEELAIHLNMLSEFLKREGWSSKDIAEALDLDISFKGKRMNGQENIPPHVVAHMRKLV